jgi:hypothetical protein
MRAAATRPVVGASRARGRPGIDRSMTPRRASTRDATTAWSPPPLRIFVCGRSASARQTRDGSSAETVDNDSTDSSALRERRQRAPGSPDRPFTDAQAQPATDGPSA